MSRRHRHHRGGNGNGGNGHGDAMVVLPHALLAETLAPGYVTVHGDPSRILAPVLELEGLDPWDEIEGPSLELEEGVEPENATLVFDDPAQLELESFRVAPAAEALAPEVEPAMVAESEPEPEAFLDVAPDFASASAAPVADEPSAIFDEAAELMALAESEDDPAPGVAVAADEVDPAPGAAAFDPMDTVAAEADVATSPEVPEVDVSMDTAVDAGGERESASAEAASVAETAAAAPTPEPAPPDPVEILYVEAHQAADAGRAEDAKRMYRELLAHHPAHVRARNNLALLLDAEGNHQGALAELDRALDIEPENGTLLVNRGALLGAMGRYAAAEHDLKKVLRVEPSHAEALFNLGVVMTKKGLWAEAVPSLKRAVELEPERAAAHFYLGEALNHVDDLAGALAAYLRATELQPSNARALYGLGIIYDRLARPDDAALMYRRSREVGRR